MRDTLFTVALALTLVASGFASVQATAPDDKYDDHLQASLATSSDDHVRVIVTTHGDPGDAADRAAENGAVVLWTYDLIDGFAAIVPVGALADVATASDVERVFLDRPTTTLMDISHRAIEADKVWDTGITGAGVTVAVLDTGIDTLHPYFAGAIAACVSTISGIVSPECTDSDGHGTHVAGTVASRDDTYPGIAPGASLAAVRVLHAAGSGFNSDIIAGMDWIVANKDTVDPPIRLATMSIGFLNPGCGDGTGPEAQAANNLVDAGLFFSVAAGNAGHNSCTIDGASAAAKVTTIAAVDDMGTVTQADDVIADFSSGGSEQNQKPDVSYPGVAITSAYIGAGTLIATFDGTSMATPHAAGTAALLYEAEPGLSAQQVKDRITGTAVKTANTGASFNLVYGHGLGNACLALQLGTCTGGDINMPPVASFTYDCTDLVCDFDGSGSSDGDGTIVSYEWDFGDGNTASGATAGHTFAADGTYTVTLTVTDDAGDPGSDAQAVYVVDTGGSGIVLSADGYKAKGTHTVDLTWTGASGAQVDIYRDGGLIATSANDGTYTDSTGNKGSGTSYTYEVCEAGTSTCSNDVTVTF